MSGNDDNPGLVVLAVDDEPGPMAMLLEVLEAEPRIGTILTATNATEALTILADTPNLPPWWRSDALVAMGEVNGERGRMVFAERNFREVTQRYREANMRTVCAGCTDAAARWW